ncbi:MAG TPA: GNAT family N-acetyltransferase [Bryobacteraceae bacterium]|nr:GNAT family N-acetyltransferase [Bryobacteraceae bacterium]
MQLRKLQTTDVPGLIALKEAAGWNQTEDDLVRMLKLSPEGCFGIEAEGTLAASASVMCYGDDLAWIGMVLTLPQYRGQGFARRLMDAVLEVAGNRAVRLDASDMGKPLYESMGFVSECVVERWVRSPAPHTAVLEVQPVQVNLALDREVFGADRSELLRDLPEGCSTEGSYAFFRPGSMAGYFGPCVSASVSAGSRLLEHYVATRGTERPLALDLFPHLRENVNTVLNLGFEPFRRLTRMVRKPARVTLPDRRIFAIAGFEWG